MTSFAALDKSNDKYVALQNFSKTHYDEIHDEVYEVTSDTPNFYWYNAIHNKIPPAARSGLASSLGTVSHQLIDVIANKRNSEISVGTLLSRGCIPIQVETAIAALRHMKALRFEILDRNVSEAIPGQTFGVKLYADMFLRADDDTNVVCEIKTSWQPPTINIPVETDTTRTHREQALMGALGMPSPYAALAVVVEIPPVQNVRTIRVKSVYYSAATVERLASELDL
jgi:hypothetical protein